MTSRFYVPRPRPVRLRTFLIVVLIASIVLGLWADRLRRRRIRDALLGPIVSAAERGDTEGVRALLDRGADVNSVTNGRYPWTPLMHAAFRGHTATARLLVERGADLDHPDLDFFTAVTLAAGEGHWEIVRLLAKRGADLRVGDGYGKRPLDYAVAAGERELAARLRELDQAHPPRWPGDQTVPPPGGRP